MCKREEEISKFTPKYEADYYENDSYNYIKNGCNMDSRYPFVCVEYMNLSRSSDMNIKVTFSHQGHQKIPKSLLST